MTVRIQDVAKHAGVSSATVSRVLSNKPHVRPELKTKVLNAVKTLGYQPNRIARSLRVQQTRIIGLLISDIQNSFFNIIVRAIEDVAYKHNYAVFLCNSDENPEKERFYLNLFKAEQVAGVILTPTDEHNSSCECLRSAGIPVVTVDRKAADACADSVVTNNADVSEQLVSLLLTNGHTRVGAVLSDLHITTGRERFEGFERALRKHGVALDPAFIKAGKPTSDDGYELTKELLGASELPTAMFTGSKHLTLGVLRALYERGLRVPDDIEVAAFDRLDWMPYYPDMFFVEQPVYALGQRAAQLLFRRLHHQDAKLEQLVLPSVVKVMRHGQAKEVADLSR